MAQIVYVTFDVPQRGTAAESPVLRGARRAELPGRLVSWELGEFLIHGIAEVIGARLRYVSDEDGALREEVVPLSDFAQNVQVFIGSLPKEYESALKTAA